MSAGLRRRAAARCVLAALALLALPGAARAYFEDVAVDSRLIAMGSSGQAESDGPSSYYWNPAGLGAMRGYGVLLDYARPYGTPDLATNAIVLGGRRLDAGFAVGWHRLAISDAYAEDLFFAAAGREFLSRPSGHSVSAGVTLKLGRVSFQPFTVATTGVDEDYGSKNAVSADAGVRWTTPWKVTLAWVLRDPLQPDYTFGDVAGAGELHASQELAFAYRWNAESTVIGSWNDAGARGNLSVGLEVVFYHVFAIRSGLTNLSEISRPDDINLGSDEFHYSGGFGVLHRGWQIDAAAVTHSQLGASYRASLSRHWGGGGE